MCYLSHLFMTFYLTNVVHRHSSFGLVSLLTVSTITSVKPFQTHIQSTFAASYIDILKYI
jgi:hypothetical protein